MFSSIIRAKSHRMPSRTTDQTGYSRPAPRALVLPLLFVTELVVLALLFQITTPVECRLTAWPLACRGVRGAALALICMAGVGGVALWAGRRALSELMAMLARPRTGIPVWPGVHGAGIALIVWPMIAMPPETLNDGFGAVLAALGGGAILAGLGALFWLAPPTDWRAWLRGRTGAVLVLLALAGLLPWLAMVLAPMWYWSALTEATFAAVALILLALGEVPVGDPAAQIIGTGDFVVAVADSCSGIEGVALITGFMALYAILFRSTLRMGRFWAVLWPAALLLSWSLNALRIALLIEIGAHGAPELAVNGFHSFAGWLFFIVLAILVLIAASRIAWLRRRDTGAGSPPLAGDAVAARIVPFIVFMISGVVAQTFWNVPALAWPWQAAAIAAALWWMRRPLSRLLRRPAPLAILVGVAIGALWVVVAPPSDAEPLPLTGIALVAWAAARLAGTVLLVPVVEELLFRGYIQTRIDDGTWPRRIAAVAISSALFAALHGRWALAGGAGVLFSLVYLRRGRLADAIAAHVAANAIVAAAAVLTGNWALI